MGDRPANHALHRWICIAGAFEAGVIGLALFLGFVLALPFVCRTRTDCRPAFCPQIGIDLLLTSDASRVLAASSSARSGGGASTLLAARHSVQLLIEVLGVMCCYIAFVLYGFAQGCTPAAVPVPVPVPATAGTTAVSTASRLHGVGVYFHPNSLWLKGIAELVSGCVFAYFAVTYRVIVQPTVPAFAAQQILIGFIDLYGGTRPGIGADATADGDADGDDTAGSSAGRTTTTTTSRRVSAASSSRRR